MSAPTFSDTRPSPRVGGQTVLMLQDSVTMVLTPSTLGYPIRERNVLRAINDGWRVICHNGIDATDRWQAYLGAFMPDGPDARE